MTDSEEESSTDVDLYILTYGLFNCVLDDNFTKLDFVLQKVKNKDNHVHNQIIFIHLNLLLRKLLQTYDLGDYVF